MTKNEPQKVDVNLQDMCFELSKKISEAVKDAIQNYSDSGVGISPEIVGRALTAVLIETVADAAMQACDAFDAGDYKVSKDITTERPTYENVPQDAKPLLIWHSLQDCVSIIKNAMRDKKLMTAMASREMVEAA